MRNGRLKSQEGFTLVELLVVVAIIAILAVVAFFGISGWVKHSRFVNSESGAKSLFYSAQAALSYQESSGKDFNALMQELQADEKDITTDGTNRSIYTINNTAGLKTFLAPYVYDQVVLSHPICLEIDKASQKAYAVFYSAEAKELTYEPTGENNSGGAVTMADRAYEARKPRGLGYYSSIDTANVKAPGLTKLKLTTLRLINDELLTLEWASNGDPGAVYYEINLFATGGNTPLTQKPIKVQWKGAAGEGFYSWVTGESETDTNRFYTTSKDGLFTLVLDGMLSNAPKSTDAGETIFSFRQLVPEDKKIPAAQQIYAAVKVLPAQDYKDEYLPSGDAKSNNANPYYGDGSKNSNISLSKFRHLYNIRNYENTADKGKDAVFQLDARSLSYKNIPVFVSTENGGLSRTAAFPTIPLLGKGHVLNGNSDKSYAIYDLLLDATSMSQENADDPEKIKKYLGLFGRNEGMIQNLGLERLTLNGSLRDGAEDNEAVYQGVGGICGVTTGKIENASIEGTITATIAFSSDEEKPSGLGGIAGVAVAPEADAPLLKNCTMKNPKQDEAKSTVKGMLKLNAALGNGDEDGGNGFLPMGIGGVVGYANVSMENLMNEAEVTGNARVGGVAGALVGSGKNKKEATLTNAQNKGLVYCVEPAGGNNSYAGKCIGGIVGYCEQAELSGCVSVPRRMAELTRDEILPLLNGKYVGGIAGYCREGSLVDCTTGEGGYVLGDTLVGGIVGAFEGAPFEKKLGAQNGAYVIGNEMVGGIVGGALDDGKNNGGKAGPDYGAPSARGKGGTLENCVNTGVVVATNRYAGGIVGYNQGTITNCVSALYDYGGAKYDLVMSWGFFGDYVGGIAGYNNGAIKYNEATKRDLAALAIGKDFVGGVAGFNDVAGDIKADYKSIGGKIKGENFVGGYIGLNRNHKEGTGQPLTVSPFGVEGKACVGGVIGGNVITTGSESHASYNVANPLAQIVGEQYVGGIMGYCQLIDSNEADGEKIQELLAAIIATATGETRMGFNLTQSGLTGFAPDKNHKFTLRDSTNEIAVQAGLLGGGIVGYIEPGSQVLITKCENKADISQSIAVGNISVSNFAYGELEKETGAFIGGIVGVNMDNATIENCKNTGLVSAHSVMGAICGLNRGVIKDCTVDADIGGSVSSFVGGITGINVGSANSNITSCEITSGVTISGNEYVGGVAGANLGVYGENQTHLAKITGCKTQAKIEAEGDYAGGVTGYNKGRITIASGKPLGNITVRGHECVGGVVGRADGGEIVCNDFALGKDGSVTGTRYVGGLVGLNNNGAFSGGYIRNEATVVAALGNAGGIVGYQDKGVLAGGYNHGKVTANQGSAGGITSEVTADASVINCENYAFVTNNYIGQVIKGQQAGGIAAVNHGLIQNCTTSSANNPITITSQGYLGGIAAENYGTVEGCSVNAVNSVTLAGNAGYIGGVVGFNHASGKINTSRVSGTSDKSLIFNVTCAEPVFGGIAGYNEGSLMGDRTANSTVSLPLSFKDALYFGGVVGDNQGLVSGYCFQGSIKDTGSSGPGRCIGGIVGRNGKPEGGVSAKVENCDTRFTANDGMRLTGTYVASNTAVHTEKASTASLAGGIAGANYQGAALKNVTVDTYAGNADSNMKISKGIIGGIVGYNNGAIERAGYPGVTQTDLFNDVNINIDLLDKAAGQIFNGLKATTLNMALSIGNRNGNGHIGGIVGLNGPDGTLARCASGKWSLVNNSSDADSTIGGIIGLNEADNPLVALVNFSNVTRRNTAPGGIIGRQENRTTPGWRIGQCLNFGRIGPGDRSAGIIGSIKYKGGTVENSINRGNMVNSVNNADVPNLVTDGTSSSDNGGIIGAGYRVDGGGSFNIVSCKNYGNATAGIIYGLHSFNGKYETHIVDCVNFADVTGAGILAAKYNGNDAFEIAIDKCRNYSSRPDSGIVGKSGGGLTGSTITVTNSFNINSKASNNNPISNLSKLKADTSYYTSAFTSSKDGTSEADTHNARCIYLGTYADYGAEPADMAFAAVLTNTSSVSAGTHSIDGNALMWKGNNSATQTEYGKILFSFPNTFTSLANIVAASTAFDAYVTAYYETLGVNQLTRVDVTPLGMSNTVSWVDHNASAAYAVEVYVFDTLEAARIPVDANTQDAVLGSVDSIQDLQAYSGNSLSFPTKPGWESKYYAVRVRAVSGAATTPWVYADAGSFRPGLPTPVVWGELVPKPAMATENVSGTSNFNYRFSVRNAAAYDAFAMDGASWRVKILVNNVAVYVTKDHPNVMINTVNNTGTIPLSAQAELVKDRNIISTSNSYSAQTNAPNSGDWVATLTMPVTPVFNGVTMDTLSCNFSLQRGTQKSGIPVYRVELVKITKDGAQTVAAYKDVALTGTGSTPVSLTNLPEGLLEEGATYKARAYLAQNGMGPTYLYHEMSAAEVTEKDTDYANSSLTDYHGTQYSRIYKATSAYQREAIDNPTYIYSTAVANPGAYAGQYKVGSLTSPDRLPVPVLEEKETLTTDTGRSMYTFKWDEGKTGAEYTDARYNVSLVGLLPETDENGDPINTEILIKSSANGKETSITEDGTNWEYSDVILRVTRLGSESAGATQSVGFKAEQTYTIAKRLPRISRPVVALSDANSISYRVSFLGLRDETHCEGYDIVIKPVGGAATVLTSVPAGQDAVGTAKTYDAVLDLTAYKTQVVELYIVAKAKAGTGLHDSPAGVPYRFTVLENMALPAITIEKTWADGVPVGETAFTKDALGIRVYSSAELAGTFVAAPLVYSESPAPQSLNETNWEASGFEKGGFASPDNPVALHYAGVQPDGRHLYTAAFPGIGAQYAGKEIAFMVRATSPTAISSAWGFSSVFRLPGISLDAPILGLTSVPRAVSGHYYLSADYTQKGSELAQTLNFRAVEWAGSPRAKSYKVDLTYVPDGAAPGETRALSLTIALRENDFTITGNDSGLSYNSTVETGYTATLKDLDETKNQYFMVEVPAMLTVAKDGGGALSFQLLLPNNTEPLGGRYFAFTQAVAVQAISGDSNYPDSAVATIDPRG